MQLALVLETAFLVPAGEALEQLARTARRALRREHLRRRGCVLPVKDVDSSVKRSRTTIGMARAS